MPGRFGGMAESGRVHRHRLTPPRAPLGSHARVRLGRRSRCRARRARSRRRCLRTDAAAAVAAGRPGAGRAAGAPGSSCETGPSGCPRTRSCARRRMRPTPPPRIWARCVAQRMPGIQDALRGFQLAWLDLPDERASQLAELPEVAADRHYLIASRRFAAHTLSAAEERALSARGGAAEQSWIRLWSERSSALTITCDLGERPGPSDLQRGHVRLAGTRGPRCAAPRTRRCVR